VSPSEAWLGNLKADNLCEALLLSQTPLENGRAARSSNDHAGSVLPTASQEDTASICGCSNLLAIVSNSSLERRAFPCCDPHGGVSSPFFPQIAACKGERLLVALVIGERLPGIV